MNYKCILYHGSHRETWTGELILLGMGDGWYEAEINGRGLTSTSSPDGINMGITCAFPTTMWGVNSPISQTSFGMRKGSAP